MNRRSFVKSAVVKPEVELAIFTDEEIEVSKGHISVGRNRFDLGELDTMDKLLKAMKRKGIVTQLRLKQ